MEMLIALVMAAIIVTPLYIITRSMSEQTGFQRMEIEAMQRARTGLNLLVRDFSRAGLFTSPNTAKDFRFVNRAVSGDSVNQYRAAVIHLNRNAGGNDAVIISGNFLGSEIYSAEYLGGDRFVIQELPNCDKLFDTGYAFAHVVNHQDTRMDIKVISKEATSPCEFQVTNGVIQDSFIALGETGLRVTSNQIALFMVENGQLVRYFLSSLGLSSEDTPDCDLTNFEPNKVTATRKVLANNVQGFQVWFRPKTTAADNASNDWNVPHYPPLSTIVDEANFQGDGLVPPADWHSLPVSIDAPPNNNHVSCVFSDTNALGPESVRSAIVRLTIRVPVADYKAYVPIEESDAGPSEGRLVLRNLASTAGGKAAYRLKSLTTEIEMPNMASRADL
jgi:hypothetical protein